MPGFGTKDAEKQVSIAENGVSGRVQGDKHLPQHEATNTSSDAKDDIQRHSYTVTDACKDKAKEVLPVSILFIQKEIEMFGTDLRASRPAENVGGNQEKDGTPTSSTHSSGSNLPLFCQFRG